MFWSTGELWPASKCGRGMAWPFQEKAKTSVRNCESPLNIRKYCVMIIGTCPAPAVDRGKRIIPIVLNLHFIRNHAKLVHKTLLVKRAPI